MCMQVYIYYVNLSNYLGLYLYLYHIYVRAWVEAALTGLANSECLSLDAELGPVSKSA